MAFCWPCSGRHCGWPVAPCCCIGANEPTGACGGPKCPSIACAGLSVSFGKPILHPWWAGTPIVDALTSPGPSVPYPGGLPFGTSADICSKTLLWVMSTLFAVHAHFAFPSRMQNVHELQRESRSPQVTILKDHHARLNATIAPTVFARKRHVAA